MIGTVRTVTRVTLGSVFAADAPLGTTLLELGDATDFDEVGGTVSINGTLYAYSDVDYDADTLTITPGLTTAAVMDDLIALWDPANGEVAVELRAGVDVPTAGIGGGDSIDAKVSHALVAYFPQGIRAEDEAESVTIEEIDGEWVVTNLSGKTPEVQAESYIAAGSFSRMVWWLGDPGAPGSGSGALLASMCANFANDQYGNHIPAGVTLWPAATSDNAMNRIIFPVPTFAAPGEPDPTKPYSKLEGLFDGMTAKLRLEAAAYQGETTPSIELVTAPAAAGQSSANINAVADRITLTPSGTGTSAAKSRVRIGSPFALGTNGLIGKYYYEEVTLDAQVLASSSSAVTMVNLTVAKAITDYASAWNLVTGVWTCPDDGIYEWSGSVKFTAWVNPSRMILYLCRNVSSTLNAFARMDSTTAGGGLESIGGKRFFATGDTVRFNVAQVTGASQTVDTSGEPPAISVYRAP